MTHKCECPERFINLHDGMPFKRIEDASGRILIDAPSTKLVHGGEGGSTYELAGHRFLCILPDSTYRHYHFWLSDW